jgi:hypothetical protein
MKWPQMLQNGKTLENDPKQLKALHNDPKWLKTTQNAPESSKKYSKWL